MSNNSKIEWTDATWTPLRARVRQNAAEIARDKGYGSLVQIAKEMAGRVGPHCERVSPGCSNCYSESNNSRCLPRNGTGLPFDRRSRDLIEPFVDEKILAQPLCWKKPRKVFVCSQTDLFGEWWTDGQIDRVFAVMALCPQHTFIVLTKRPERMQKYFKWRDVARLNPPRDRVDAIGREANEIWRSPICGSKPYPLGFLMPLPNVWLGVSVERRENLNRIDVLRATPAALRFLSLEPLLEDLGGLDLRGIDWVITGPESGVRARPMDEDWVRSLRDQCVAAGVAFFYKQKIEAGKKIGTPLLDGRRWMEWPR
jgi:protein gp37